MIHEKDLVIVGDEAWLVAELERKQRSRRWDQEHRDRKRERDRRYIANLSETKRKERNERSRRWDQEHPERQRERDRRYRLRKREQAA